MISLSFIDERVVSTSYLFIFSVLQGGSFFHFFGMFGNGPQVEINRYVIR